MAGATLRIELFPQSLIKAVDFYSRVLDFKVLRYEPDNDDPNSTTGYAHLRRDTIQIGLATVKADRYPDTVRNPSQRAQFRAFPTGVEVVIEVDDLQAEHSRVVNEGWEVENGVKLQGKHEHTDLSYLQGYGADKDLEWGLQDFRIRDPDGYYLRISERGGHDGRRA